MKPSFNEKLVAYLALISGLSISAVAVYYSVVGLAAIFAAAVIPIVIMGVALEISKLVATVWLKQNWKIAPLSIKAYLMTAIFVLMFITSMGIFGFLSKAHLDQSLPTGDIAAKVALIDEKIKTQKENLQTAKNSLEQLNSQVNARLSRSEDERGAERAVQIRRQQAGERNALQKEITQIQAEINKLNTDRAPLAAELRKVEVEVGPIKYIANFFYGTSDQTVLEKAVVWVIIILIFVFDPLAVILLLVSQISFQRFREQALEVPEAKLKQPIELPVEESKIESTEGNSPEKESDIVSTATVTEPAPHHPDTHPYLNQGFKYPEGHEFVKPVVYRPEEDIKPTVESSIVFPTIEEPVKEETPDVVQKPLARHKIFRRPQIVITTESSNQDEKTEEPLFVQNEEQQESNLWSTSTRAEILAAIEPEDYNSISQEKIDERINFYANLVRNRQLSMSDVPKELLLEVRARV